MTTAAYHREMQRLYAQRAAALGEHPPPPRNRDELAEPASDVLEASKASDDDGQA